MEDIVREKMEVDVLLVGAGPASLSAAYEIAKSAAEHDALVEKGELKSAPIGPLNICVLEKCREVGDSILSGAVMDPRGIEKLMPDWKERGAPIESIVTHDAAYFLTKSKGIKFPLTPPPLQQHGNYIISLSKWVRWMNGILQEMGVNIFTGFAGTKVLTENGRVIGVRTGDKGIGKNGERKDNFEAGIDILAKVTILGEGVRGSLTRDLIKEMGLDKNSNPPSYGTGVKEVWELRPGAFDKGMVYHTMGFPQRKGVMGGGWLYGMDNNLLSIGWVTWLSYADPFTNPHENFQMYKNHPMIRKILEGGKMVQYGAKAVSVGGYYSIPKMAIDGCLLIGESANLVDGQKLKGVHMAIASGQMAGQTVLKAFLKGDFTEATLVDYPIAFESSYLKEDLMLSRNFHQSFEHGFLPGLIRSGMQTVLKGRDPLGDQLPAVRDVEHMEKIAHFHGDPKAAYETMKYDGKVTFDKLTDVFSAGSIHEEDQPSHLVVHDTDLCAVKCAEEYGNPCTKFCPAQVYEMEEKEGKNQLKLNPSNCVHCKTCDIMDPYINIRWVTPEGGGGPQYTVL